jgi:hypothetical protein
MLGERSPLNIESRLCLEAEVRVFTAKNSVLLVAVPLLGAGVEPVRSVPTRT